MSSNQGAAPRGSVAELILPAAAAAVSITLGLEPTGRPVTDAILVGGTCGLAAWAACRAPWWLLALTAGIAAAIAATPWALVVGVGAAFAAIATTFAPPRWTTWLAAGASAGSMLALCGLRSFGHLGLSAAIALALGLAASMAGAVRRGRGRWAVAVVGGAVAITAVSSLLLGAGAASARQPLRSADEQTRAGLKALQRGEVDEAKAAFIAAQADFDRALDALERPWTQPARLVPIAAQHRAAAIDLASGAERALQTISTTLDGLDLDSVRVDDGRIDVAAVEALGPSLETVAATIDDIDRLVRTSDDQWLVEPLRDRLHDLSGDIDEYRSQADDALAAVRAAPAILGVDGPRVYFIAFATPAEARGSLGFMGNWAELTVDDGQIEMTRFGRTDELNAAGDPDRRLTGMDEFLARYGGYGFDTGPDGTTADSVWHIMTLSPHFPSVAEAIAQLYPQSGGQEIDGVFALDPAALAGLLELTGPIEADGVPYPLDASNVEEFLNVDQYIDVPDRPDRIDALESVALTTVNKVLDGSLPGPVELGRTFGPLVRSHHVAGWLREPTEQDLAIQLELDHSLPDPTTSDVAVSINNSGGNKIDAYADVTVDYSRPDAAGQASTVGVSITNTAPSTGLPNFVIGNSSDLPSGTNVSYVSVFVPSYPTAITIDGQPVEFDVSAEQGWYVASGFVTIPSGATGTFAVTFEAPTDGQASVPVAVFGPDTRRAARILVNAVEQ